MQRSAWVWMPVAAISSPAYAAVYLSIEQAREVIFPGGRFREEILTLTEDQASEITRRSGLAVHHRQVKLWREAGGGIFLADQVIGKHEAIDFAVGLTPAGVVKQVEILEYRESRGYEVRNPRWRAQFVGKGADAPLKLDEDIRNISGATLSCGHVTEGVRRILATFEVAIRGGRGLAG